MADDDHAHELLIIKRHGGDHEDAHHGGVWKIAFADFMTAMMAFFLVMWLISANDKTKATIASYFNPVKLVDTTTQPKGLEDAKAVESVAPSTKGSKSSPSKESPSQPSPKADAQEGAKAGGQEQSATKAKEKRLASAVLDDPFAALAEIAGAKGTGDRGAAAAGQAASNNKIAINAISRKGGDAFRDPFAPPPPLQAASPSEDMEDDAKPHPPGGRPDSPPSAKSKGETASRSATPDADVNAAQKGRADQDSAAQLEAQQLAARIRAEIRAVTKGAGQDKSAPQVDVRKTDGGLLISLTDAADFAMFASGSAVPERKVVLLMDRIAQILKAKPGQIVIRGFTDARPFKAGKYDNWHLSLDRAQVTHYMLIRGGIDESRIAHIEGYADRSLKMPSDPTSPVNRRIEILLKSEAP